MIKCCMELSLLNLFNHNQNNGVQTRPSMSSQRPSSLPAGNYDNLKSLKKDTVSFKGTVDNSRSALPAAENAEIAKIKNELGEETIKNCDAKKILPYFGIDVKENENGLLTISKYRQPGREFTFEDLGIDENKLFENVEYIDGCADFRDSSVTNLGQLKSIGGNAYFGLSQVTDLGQLQSIDGNVMTVCSKLKPEDFENVKVKGRFLG